MKLFEIFAPRIASLYHGTGLFNAARIIQTNKIEDKTSQGFGNWENAVTGVSLSRNKNIAMTFGYVVFELDQKKLKNNHKIIPTDYWHHPLFKPTEFQKIEIQKIKDYIKSSYQDDQT